MIRKSIVLWLLLAVTVFTGCGNQDFSELSSSALTVSSKEPTVQEPVLYANPLTGVKELEEDARNKRPVAVMVNNIAVAQSVQCGLNDADLVFECLVEGGISRLMAVYYDIGKVGQIGTVRSARYTYVQLCQWLDAVYVHHGVDQVYTRPYIRELGMDDFDPASYSSTGFRESNGLAWEHRLYTNGEKLAEKLQEKNWRLTGKDGTTQPVFQFAQEPVTPDTPCTAVTYAMSGSYKTTFAYDSATGKYIRKPMGSTHKDCKTGEATVTDNVFVLYADHSYFADDYHLRTVLSSGDGLYVSAGGCRKIRWQKGDAGDALKLTDGQGNPLTVNPGTSWIAFVPDSNQSKTVTE